MDLNERARDNAAKLLGEGAAVDYSIIFILATKLTRPLREWKAYRLGIINEDGDIVKKPSTWREKNSLTPLDRFVLKIREIIDERKLRALTAYFLLSETVDENLPESEGVMLVEERHMAERLYDDLVERVERSGLTIEEFWSLVLKTRLEV